MSPATEKQNANFAPPRTHGSTHFLFTKLSEYHIGSSLCRLGNSEFTYKYNKKSGLDFIESYDNNEDYFVDSNLNYNLAFNLNETLHLNTFVNVFTETLFEEDTIFLSEKIFKPLFCCQPFIVFGNPGTLEELQKIGFKLS